MKHNTLGLSLERGKADQCLVPRKQSVNSNGSYNLHESCVLSTYCELGTASGNSLYHPCCPWLKTSPLLDPCTFPLCFFFFLRHKAVFLPLDFVLHLPSGCFFPHVPTSHPHPSFQALLRYDPSPKWISSVFPWPSWLIFLTNDTAISNSMGELGW